MNTADRLLLERQLREASEEARDAEIANRARDHKVQVDRVKRAAKFRKPKQPAPLDFLAIGDSWFEYPLDNGLLLPPFEFGIVAKSQLQSLGNPNPLILSQAHHGQATTAVLSYKRQQDIIDVLEDRNQWINGKGPDAILVSAGGNDIVGDQFAIYIEYGGVKGLSSRFDGALESVKVSYMDLFALRDEFAAGVPIFGHCYDYALPNGRQALIFGPWLKPSLNFALYYNYNDGSKVVHEMIGEFYKMLNGLALYSSDVGRLVELAGL